VSATALTIPLPDERARRASVPWTLYAVLFASTSIIVGVLWDISWHSTIGRDSFWTPAHVAIYLGGVVGGLACGWLALRITFAGTAQDRDRSVRFWRVFRAPLGAWVCIWGTFAMLTSAPFDDWWHNAYGLDVKILSPPHVLLALGIFAVQYGAMLMALSYQNRDDDPTWIGRLYLYSAGLVVLNVAIMGSEYLRHRAMHQSLFYQVACAVFPLIIVAAARPSRARWPATTVTAVYMLIVIAMMQILPRFSAEPRLGPIYVHLTSFLPPGFPLLLIAPAAAMDVLMRRFQGRDWLLALLLAAAFLCLLLAVEWPFADFLTTPAARNAFFAADRMPYNLSPEIQQRLSAVPPSDNLARGLPFALVLGFLSARVGLWWGNWMARVQR
jgi:hypothetical protein